MVTNSKSLLFIAEGIAEGFNEQEFIDSIVGVMRSTGRQGYYIEQHAEEDRKGIVLLTIEEAKLLQYVCNPDNWLVSTKDAYCGVTEIDARNPIDIERIPRVLSNYFKTGTL